MTRTKLIAGLFNLYSISAVAGYQCTLQLAHTEDLDTVIASKTIEARDHEMRSGNYGELFLESQKGKRKTSLTVNAFISGTMAEEEAIIVMMRKHSKRKSSSSEAVSEKFPLRGDESDTFWFDSYKLDVSCRITNA